MADESAITPAWRLLLALLARLPQGALSRGFGRIADIPIPRSMRSAVLGAFARGAGIDLTEVEQPLSAYPTLNAFFVRRLRDGARNWPADPAIIASPADAELGQLGAIHAGRLLQAKGRHYSLAQLLDDVAEAERFEGGTYLTLYLSPRHYHRVHTPIAGDVVRVRHIPGALLPVNHAAVMQVDALFPRNERVVCYIQGDCGRAAVVAVGAFNVGRITLAFEPEAGAVSNRRGAVAADRALPAHTRLERGAELLAFHLGSTVVLLLPPGRARLVDGLERGAPVRVGAPVARAS